MTDLVTGRLLLHPMSVAEAEQLVAGEPAAGERWAPGYPEEVDVLGARRYLEACAVTGDQGAFGAYEIRRRADGAAIGGAGFHGPPDEHGDVTVGYGLIPAVRGHGYAAEALRGLLALAGERGARRVLGDTARDNVASQRVMTAAGMRLVREEDGLRYYAVEV
ncbi:GNAT family N-acetyltransferase [Actinomadura macrotermitis]|uniref:N-acetyltransferase domain-containing protein n=1 Tax=Actinomadura macrotermitis TaxID=2585200 RepID=A0A7K0C514_9ACTN|nr:GNAT family N-acetyltransferase [Actinomadura macrotermitis]MQY08525.1 hypothetical protein [Actinomadura macrotermitis]